MRTALLLLWCFGSCRTSSSHASLTVSPSRSQFFQYEDVNITCEPAGPGEWKVWRYTTNGLQVSKCGSEWGTQISSTCSMKTVRPPFSGVYWCESKHRDSSNAVNITVTSGSVILESPVLPVMEGDDVTLSCQSKTSSKLSADFYKDDSLIGTEAAGHMTLHHVSRSDEGLYRCRIRTEGESPSSWLLRKDPSAPASLTVSPDSSQLFNYQSVFFSCGDDSSLHGWRVKKFSDINRRMFSCGDGWGNPNASGCYLTTAHLDDSATYWCESPSKQRSNTVQISVHGGPVILQSPVLPVMEGDDVTLSCQSKTSSKLPADFYKDDSLIGTEAAGHMTLHHVNRSDEGLYRCRIRTEGESPSSWLLVKSPSAPHPPPVKLNIMSHIIKGFLFFHFNILLILYLKRLTGKNCCVSVRTSVPREEDDGTDHNEAEDNVTTEYRF